MADIQLGKAYVQIIPSAKGIKGMLSNEMEPEAREAGKKSGGSILSTMGKTIAAGAAVVAGAAAALVSQSVKEFSQYEQLAGGAELLFGNAYSHIAGYAKDAWKNVQMSQNEYLEEANKYAVGLKDALKGNVLVAAQLTNDIITAQADVVAATGKDAESVANAFSGIMRGQYNMLDNLGLGIKASQAGMQEAMDKVNAWNKAQGNATHYQMGNYADMEQALVDYVKMVGLSGYANKEASETIMGSLSSVKSTWANMLVAMADDNGDFEGSVQNLAESAAQFGKNLIPRISTALKALPVLVKELAPVIIQELPGLVSELLPEVVKICIDLIVQIATMLPDLLSTLIPVLIDSILLIVRTLLPQIPEILRLLIPAVVDGTLLLVNSIIDMLPELIETVVTVLIDSAPILLDGIWKLIIGLLEALEKLGVMLYDYVLKPAWDAVVEWFGNMSENAKEGASNFITNVIEWVKQLPEKIAFWLGEVIGRAARWVVDFSQKAKEAAIQFINNAIDWIKQLPAKIGAFLTDIIARVISWAKEFPERAKTAATNMFNVVVNTLTTLPGKIVDIGRNVVEGLWKGITNAADWLRQKISGFVGNILSGFKKGFDTNSPSKKMMYFGEMIDLGLAAGMENNMDAVADAIDDITNLATGTMQSEIMVNGSVRNPAAYTNPNSGMAALLDAVDTIAMRLNHMQIVLDSGALVGGISEQMDGALGDMQTQVKRGMLA